MEQIGHAMLSHFADISAFKNQHLQQQQYNNSEASMHMHNAQCHTKMRPNYAKDKLTQRTPDCIDWTYAATLKWLTPIEYEYEYSILYIEINK